MVMEPTVSGMPGMLVESGRRDECAAETAAQFASASTPRLLMLARYPPSAGGYVPHLDNDAADPDHQRGPVGLRACDRVYTCILYLQSGWSEADDGRLRLHRPRGRAERGEAAAAAEEEEEEEGASRKAATTPVEVAQRRLTRARGGEVSSILSTDTNHSLSCYQI